MAMSKTSKKLSAMSIIQQLGDIMKVPYPSLQDMVVDLKTTNYKIRALEGSVEGFDFADVNFLKSLWRISRVDSIVEEKLHLLSDPDKDRVLSYIHDANLNSIPQKQVPSQYANNHSLQEVQLEIFREKSNRVVN